MYVRHAQRRAFRLAALAMFQVLRPDVGKQTEGIQMLSRINCLDPTIFAYNSDIEIRDDGGALAIGQIAITEYVEISLLCFLSADRNSAIGITCIDPRISDDCRALLVPLTSVVCHEVDTIGFPAAICGCSFDPLASVIA